MNFLQMAQRLRQEALGAGASALPSATTSQAGQSAQFVSWINTAWMDIQNMHRDWLWMRRACTVNTVSGTGSYASTAFTDVAAATLVSAFSHWLFDYKRRLWTIYLSSGGQSGEVDLIDIDFDSWRFLYDRGAAASQQSQPVYVTAANDLTVKIGPKPNAVYVIRGWYQQAATELSGDADIPELPTQYHMMIVWKALTYYAQHAAAPEKMAMGQNNFSMLLSQLEINQLPGFSLGGPLVE